MRQQAAARRQRLAPLSLREKELEKQMEKTQKRLKQLEELLADETLYDESRKQQLNEFLLEQGKCSSDLKVSEEQWLEVQEEIAEFE